MRYLLDTDICVDVLRGDEGVVARLRKVPPADCAISVITSFELFAGAAKAREPSRERKKIETLLGAVRQLSFSEREARRAGDLRGSLEKKGRMVGAYDLLIAAQALAAGLTLVTANAAEFGRIEDLVCENWPS